MLRAYGVQLVLVAAGEALQAVLFTRELSVVAAGGDALPVSTCKLPTCGVSRM
jgi:hypothetical protein